MRKITAKSIACTAIFTLLAPTLSHADEISRMAGLSKRAFMAVYEEKFVASLELNRELIHRFDPKFVESLDIDTPMTSIERAAMECSYDIMDEKGKLDELAVQIQTFEVLEKMMDEDPEMDFVDLVMNPDVVGGYTAGITDDAMSVLATCKYPQASQGRINFTPEFWSSLAEAAQERGYEQ